MSQNKENYYLVRRTKKNNRDSECDTIILTNRPR